MKPYYSHAGITIYHGDCREILPQLPKASCHLLVTDPPYGVGFISGRRDSMGEFGPIFGDDGSVDITACIELSLEKLENGKHVYIFGPADLSRLPLGGLTELIWDKELLGLGNTELPWAPSHERISFAVYSNRPAGRAEGHGKGAARMRRGTVLRVQRMQSVENKNHPTEKPILLLREFIESSSHIGDVVLDPFMGSGATIEAAKKEDRRAIGIEIEEKYCEIAAKRLRQEVFQF